MTGQTQQRGGIAVALIFCVATAFALMDDTVRTPQMTLLSRTDLWMAPLMILCGIMIAWDGYQRRKKGE